MHKLIKWFDTYVLHALLLGFIFLIPLYPKFPIRIVDYTNIAVRAEDFYFLLFFVTFMIQLIRHKVVLKKTYLILFLLYWAAVFASFFWGAFVSHTIPQWTTGFLHAARRFEYMAIFFFASSIVTSRKLLFMYLKVIFIAFFLVILYAMGQKFAEFPAVQTMNPEFAKGHLLILTPEARISSTFAGHYDLAAYIVFLTPILLGYFFYTHNYFYFALFIGSLYTLLLTASRISFGAYLVSTFSYLLFNKKFKYFLIIGVLTGVMMYVSGDLTKRFAKTFQVKQLFVNEKTGQVVVPQQINSKELPAGTFYIETNKKTKENSEKNEEQVKRQILAEIRDQAKKSNVILTASEEAAMVASASSGLRSVNTVVSDISFSTRLQIEWPRAIEAFLSNPILGKGPSSITEATDNDYLRWLGEFGLLATGILFSIFFKIAKDIWLKSRDFKKERIVFIGFLFGFGALLLNASYIDVFEASKVAYYFWLLAGMFIGAL